ncbi:MAG: ABC transporter permease, partial [Spirochaetes bacterium]|nr:ABC transporter permease [Spirochaetota bacterium]
MMVKTKQGGFLYLIKIAYRNIFRNMRRSILCITAISLAVFLIIFMMSYIEGMLDSAKKIAQTFDSGHIKIMTKEFEEKEDFFPLQYPIDDVDKYIDEIKTIDGVKVASPRILSFTTLTSSKVKHGVLAGVNFEEIINTAEEKNRYKYAYYNFTKKSNGLLAGRFPDSNKNECMIGYRLAKKMEIILPIIENHEFNWIIDNLNNENDKKLFQEIYKSDDKLQVYNLHLFQNNNWDYNNGDKKLSKNELKKITRESKKNYLKLLGIFINLEIKNIPKQIGIDANVLDYVFIKDYVKEDFLQAYKLDNKTKTYKLKSNTDASLNERLLKTFNKALTLRIPLKIVSSQYSDKYYQPKLVGVFEYDYMQLDGNFILIPLKKMQRLASLANKTQCIYIYVDKIKDAGKIKNEIIKKINNQD